MTLGEYAAWLLVAVLFCVVGWLGSRRRRRKDTPDPMQTAHLNEAWGNFPHGDPK